MMKVSYSHAIFLAVFTLVQCGEVPSNFNQAHLTSSFQVADDSVVFPDDVPSNVKTLNVSQIRRVAVGDPANQAELRHYATSANLNLDQQYAEPYKIDYKYHRFDQMTQFLRQTTARYPSLTALYSIGKSVKGYLKFTAFFFV